jgi:hypothetical protein
VSTIFSKSKKIKNSIYLILLFGLLEIYSENLFFKFQVGFHKEEIQTKNVKSISIPFNYPFELKFHPDYNSEFQKTNLSSNSNPKVYFPNQITQTINYQISDSKEIVISTFQNQNHFDAYYFERDTNTRLPNLWQLNPSATNTNSGIVFSFLGKNFSFYNDFSTRFLGLESGHSALDSFQSNVGLIYNLASKSNPYRINYVISLNQVFYSEDKTTYRRKIDLNKNSQFFSQGFSVQTKSAIFEGLIRVPTQLQATYEVDGLWRPEVQGRIGIKWNLPEYIRP